ncbi:MAG: phosphohydrolase, partial [Nitrospirota bacterium]
MHKNCITIGNKSCEIGQNFAQLLIEEGVDIVLQGHDHDYQRSHSLGIVQPGTFPSGAVVDDGSDNEYFRGAGTVFVIVGTVGKSLNTCSHFDSEYKYFAVHLCREEGNSKGYLLINATDTRMDMEFIAVDGTFQDTFSIH